MNKQRREKLFSILKRLRDLHSELESLIEEEDESRDNIPENLQSSNHYVDSEDASESMGDAFDSIGEAIESLEKVI